MAPKNKVEKDSKMSPTVVRTEVVLCGGGLGVAPDVRDDGQDVDGQVSYGSGILTIPSLLLIENTAAPSTRDGRARLNNGKSTIMALKRLEHEFRDAIPTASSTEACPQVAVNASTEACPQVVVNAWRFPTTQAQIGPQFLLASLIMGCVWRWCSSRRTMQTSTSCGMPVECHDP